MDQALYVKLNFILPVKKNSSFIDSLFSETNIFQYSRVLIHPSFKYSS